MQTKLAQPSHSSLDDKIDPAWAWAPFKPTAKRPWDRRLAAHLYRRATFAANHQELLAAVKNGLGKTLDSIFDTDSANEFNGEMDKSSRYLTTGGSVRRLSSWWMLRMMNSPSPILEKMTLFWHGHFSTGNEKVQNASLKAYTIGFDEHGYDETEYAKLAASTYDVPISIYNVTPEDILATIDIVADSFDEPFGNSSAIPTYHCAAFAAEDGQSVLLAGDGGDELFSGNERYRTQQIFSWYQRVPRFLRKGVLEPFFLGPMAKTEFLPVRKARRYA